jgi:flagellar basal-body rod protein FlgC
MLDAFSAALSGLSAASRRLEASANNIANAQSRGALPSAGDAAARQAYQPVRVEQTSTGGASGGQGTIANFRGTTPSFLAVFDPQHSAANVDGFVAEPNVDLVEETTELTEASASFEANQKAIQAASDLVKKLYDLV